MFDLTRYDGKRIWVLTLDNPPANALGREQVAQLDRLMDEASADPDLRAVIFRSKSRFFSAGADIALIDASLADPAGAAAMEDFCRELQRGFAKIEALEVPTFAAISGICVGGGLELALACDFRIVARNARLGLPEVRIGLLPGAGGTQRLTGIAGKAVALRLIMTGELVSGAEAQALGLASECLDDGDVFERTLAFARRAVEAPRKSLAAIKRCVALAPSPEGFEAEIEETGNLHREAETRDRVRAFLSRTETETETKTETETETEMRETT